MKLLLSPNTQRQLDALVAKPGGSYLFCGPAQVGKYTAANAVAGEITAHPSDVITIVPDGLSIGIEQVHELNRQLHLKAANSRQPRVVVIDGAETLTNEAQNALLKLLEEPPLDTTIILVANERQKLLSTIQSRCRTINFAYQPEAQIAQWLIKQCQLSQSAAAELANLGAGTIGLAIELSEDTDKRAQLQQQETWAQQLQTGDLYGSVLLAKELGGDRQLLQAVVRRLLALAQKQLRQAAGNTQQLVLALRRLQTVLYTLRYLEANGSPKFALDNLALGLAQ